MLNMGIFNFNMLLKSSNLLMFSPKDYALLSIIFIARTYVQAEGGYWNEK
jgi:hypothetical protein